MQNADFSSKENVHPAVSQSLLGYVIFIFFFLSLFWKWILLFDVWVLALGIALMWGTVCY